MNNFKDKVVWITGASSGYGEALAKSFSNCGAKVIVSARRIEKLKELCTTSNNIKYLPFDMKEMEKFPEITQHAISLFGHIDILINNAAVAQKGSVIETELDIARHIMEIDYFSHTELTRSLLPHFLKRKQGRIVIISGLLADITLPLRSSYAAAKSALIAYFGTLRAELINQNIDVTILIPGAMQTELVKNAILPDGLPANSQVTKIGCPLDIATEQSLTAIKNGVYEAYIGLHDKAYDLWKIIRSDPNQGIALLLEQIKHTK